MKRFLFVLTLLLAVSFGSILTEAKTSSKKSKHQVFTAYVGDYDSAACIGQLLTVSPKKISGVVYDWTAQDKVFTAEIKVYPHDVYSLDGQRYLYSKKVIANQSWSELRNVKLYGKLFDLRGHGFEIKPDWTWERGKYRVELWVNDRFRDLLTPTAINAEWVERDLRIFYKKLRVWRKYIYKKPVKKQPQPQSKPLAVKKQTPKAIPTPKVKPKVIKVTPPPKTVPQVTTKATPKATDQHRPRSRSGLRGDDMIIAEYEYKRITAHVLTKRLPGTIPLHRYYSVAEKNHFYTTNVKKYGKRKNGYKYERIQCYVFPTKQGQTVPLFCFYSAKNGDHYYTISKYRAMELEKDYLFKGIVGYVYPFKAEAFVVPLYCYWSEKRKDHFYSTVSPDAGVQLGGNY